MSVKIRLQRHGRKQRPLYHIVAADARAPRDGRFIEKLGTYNPMTKPATIILDVDRAYEWLSKGAEPTDTARAILRFKGVMYKKHLMRGVKKGALTVEQADAKLAEWIREKEAKVSARIEQTLKEKDDFNIMISGTPKVRKAPVVDEAPVVEEAAPVVEEKVEEIKAAAPVVETVAEKVEKVKEAAPVVEAVTEKVEEVKEAAPVVEEKVEEVKAAAPVVEEKVEEVKAAAPVVEEKVEEVKAAAPVVEEKIEEVKAAAPVAEKVEEVKKAAPGKVADVEKSDDLTKVEGIGPKIAELLHGKGINTYAELAAKKAKDLETILAETKPSMAAHKPTTWPKQADMAANGKWDELKVWQDALDGGKEVDDLTKVEGIGPKIAELLRGKGIISFADLAAKKAEDLATILAETKPSMAAHKPTTWPEQAGMAANGKWDELKAWQDKLDGGKA